MVSAGSSSALSPPLLLSPVGLSLLFAVFVAMHFQSLTGLSLSIDDDTAILRTDPSIWLHEGRWGAYLVERFIMPLPAITFLPYAVFGACLCLAFALLAISLGITTLSWEILLGFALFVGVPQWLFLMEFSANIVPVGIGFLCAAASVVTLDWAAAQRRGIPERLAFVGTSVVLLALATGLYQSLLLAGLLLASAVVVVRLARAEIDLQDAARMHAGIAFVGALAYALYAAVSEIFSCSYQISSAANSTPTACSGTENWFGAIKPFMAPVFSLWASRRSSQASPLFSWRFGAGRSADYWWGFGWQPHG